jgi:RNA polymerase sigma factor (TIGR02999 family)
LSDDPDPTAAVPGAVAPVGEVTGLLLQWQAGDAAALDQLLPLVYGELHRLADRQLRGERREHTLQPTAVVHEAYLRLVDQRRATWQNRAQFFGVAAQLMRRVLVDHARARRTAKRGALAPHLPLDDADAAIDPQQVDLVDLDAALSRLEALDADQARVVELRFFGGLSVEETAEVVGTSPATVKRDWHSAKAWLFRELGGTPPVRG